MTEQELRAIIREEIFDAAHKEGGLLDDARSQTFSMAKGMIQMAFKHGLSTFDEPEAPGEPENSTAH